MVSGAASESEEEELPSDSDFDQDDEEDALALDQDDSMEVRRRSYRPLREILPVVLLFLII